MSLQILSSFETVKQKTVIHTLKVSRNELYVDLLT